MFYGFLVDNLSAFREEQKPRKNQSQRVCDKRTSERERQAGRRREMSGKEIGRMKYGEQTACETQ